jgi:hypothetical protein
MTAHTLDDKLPSQKPLTVIAALQTPKEAAQFLKLSTSWLAEARMRGDGATLHPDRPVHSLQRGRLGAMDEVAAAPLHQRAIAMVVQRPNVLRAWPISIFEIMIHRDTSQYIK